MKNDILYKKNIKNAFRKYGIDLDLETGIISYSIDLSNCELNCQSFWFMRHGNTIASENHRFISLFSENSQLSISGINTVKQSIKTINEIDIDVILYSPIPRVIETVDIVRKYKPNYSYKCLDFLIGIDNAAWEDKTLFELTERQRSDYFSREYIHNVFAKSDGGNCWADVLMNCIKLVEYINEFYSSKNILLISQESILWGVKIIMHMHSRPWDEYSAKRVFNLTDKCPKATYGQVYKIL